MYNFDIDVLIFTYVVNQAFYHRYFIPCNQIIGMYIILGINTLLNDTFCTVLVVQIN